MPKLLPSVASNVWFAMDETTWTAVTTFLNTVDEVAPSTSRELLSMVSLFTDEVANHVDEEWSKYSEMAFASQVPFHTLAPWVPPIWIVLRDADSEDCTRLLSAVDAWAAKSGLVDLNNNRRRFVEIGLNVLRKVRKGWTPPEERPILSEGFVYDTAASGLSVQFSPNVVVPDTDGAPVFSSLYPVVFAPPAIPLHNPLWNAEEGRFETAGDFRPVAEWEKLLYEHRAMQLSGQPVKHKWAGAAWDPLEPWQEFHDRMIREFESYLRAYRNRITNSLANSFGWEEFGVKREAEHFKWLAMYQCGDYSYDKIQKTAHSTKQNVMQRVREAAKTIGISLKPSRVGREPSVNKQGRVPTKRRPGRPRKTDIPTA